MEKLVEIETEVAEMGAEEILKVVAEEDLVGVLVD